MKKITCFLLFLLGVTLTAFAQQGYVVTGTVFIEEGEPASGATVVEAGTVRGVTTDLNGRFTLSVAGPNAMVRISYLGYVTVEYPANSPLFAQGIHLQSVATALADVVVIGYGTVRKKDLTGSVSVVAAEGINRGVATSATDLLLAKVPGLHIIPGDGGPNSGPQLRIRGGASLTASNDPLIVIDGIPVSSGAGAGMSNPLALLNPEDIESFSVLKDASSTAIYGSRASNGVVIITTKKGKGSKPTISYNSSYYLRNIYRTINTFSPSEYRDFMLEFYPEGTPNGTTVRDLMGDANTKWQDYVYRNGLGTDQNISVYGNYQTVLPYRVSGGYTTERGTLQTSKFQRGTLDVSLTPNLLDDHLNIIVNAKGVYNNNHYANGGAVNAAAFFDPTQSPHFHNSDGSIDYDKANGWFNWIDVYGKPISVANINPLSTLYDNYDRNDQYRFLGNIQLDYKMHFLPELRANLNLGLDYTTTDGKTGTNPGSINALRDTDLTGYGRFRKYNNLRRDQTLEFYMAYAKELNKHRFDVLAGHSWQHFFLRDNDITYANVTNEVYTDSPADAREYFLLSFFGRGNYSYDGKYLLTFTFRSDGSSRFAKENRWGFFPSAALAWNLKQEEFLNDSGTVSDLKLRLGWGSTGQQDIGGDYYSYMPRYILQSSPETKYNLGDGFYSPLQPLAYNSARKWETTDTYNVGVDFGFFGGRLNGSLDVYLRKTRDLLNDISVPLGSNFSNRIIFNIGDMENRGVELNIGAIPFRNNDWKWNVNFNATLQKTKITKLTNREDKDYMVSLGGISSGTGSRIQIHKVGYAPGTFFCYQQVYDADGKPVQNAFVDRDGDRVITEADRYITDKSPTPKFYFGLGTSLAYRNWDFGFNSHASFGNWMFNDYRSGNSTPLGNFMSQGFLVNISREVLKTGFTQASSSEQKMSDMFLENASFFKLDDITLGYTFKSVLGTKLSLRTAFSVQNVFTVTKYTGLDPEGWGIDNNIWPRPRTFTLRMNINF